MYPKDHENQLHHPGAPLIFGPDDRVLASPQLEQIREEMAVATLEAASPAEPRAYPNYQLKTRRPELYGELVRELRPRRGARS